MKNKTLIIILTALLLVPQVTLGVWYNPLSWNIWSNTWNAISNTVTNTVSTIASNVFHIQLPTSKQVSSRFIDNGDRSITDTQSGNTWLKCDYGLEGQNCDQKSRKIASVGIVTCGGPGVSPRAPGNQSAEAYCNNGVLCKDGTFVTVNWLDDMTKHKNEYLEYQLLQTNCYVGVQDTAKERACEQHGGISKKDWRVPTLEELKTLDTKNQFGLDKKYFPNSLNKFITSTSFFNETGMVENMAYSYNFQGHSSDKVQSASLKCVTDERGIVSEQQTQDGGDIFCQTKFPWYKYSEYETVFSGNTSQKQTTKQWEKEDVNFVSIYGTTIFANSSNKVWFWEIRNKKTGDVTTYNCDNLRSIGQSNCSRTIDNLKIPEKLEIVYNSELGAEQKTIGGQKCTMLKKPKAYDYSLGLGKNQNIGYVDCINKTSCEFLIDSADNSNDAKTKFIKIDYAPFSDSIFNPPTDYTEQDNSVSQSLNSDQFSGTSSVVEVSNVKDSDVQSILNKFCSGTIKIDYKKTDYSAEYTKKLDALKINELISNLNDGKYVGNQLPEALRYLGSKLMQVGMVDNSGKVYACAGIKYYDIISLYRSAILARNGTEDGIKKQLPNAIIKEEFKPNFIQAYTLLSMAMSVESVEKTGLLMSDTLLGWNYRALLDDLQNTGKLTAEQKVNIEKLARDYVGARYPEVLK